MTVQSQKAKSGPYAGAGTVGPFPVDFRFLEDTHLRVIKTDAAGTMQTLTLTADYTVTGAGNQSGGSVTLNAALAAKETLVVLRNVPATQLADYVEGDAFPAESHERALDKLTMLVQQQGEGLGRALTMPESDIAVSGVLPPIAQRARRYLSFDETGQPVTTTFDVDAVATASQQALDAAAAAATSEQNAAQSEANAADSESKASDFAGAVQAMVEGAMPSVHRFVGDGEQTDFDLGVALMDPANVLVFLDGANQEPVEDYAVDGTVLKLEEAPADGVKGVAFVSPNTALAIGDAKNIIVVTDEGTTTVEQYLQVLSNQAEYLRESTVIQFESVAALRASPPPNKKTCAYVHGYHESGDGGGGSFVYIPASTKPDNGGNVIVPNSAPANGRWEWGGVADVRRFGAQLNTGDSTLAIRAALKTGQKVLFSGVGDYFVSGELEVTHAGQVIEWEQTGGYGYGTTSGAMPSWKPLCRVQARGTFSKRLRTRRLHRASALSAQDNPLSVVFNVQADGVHFTRPAVDLYCDYTDTSPTNEGDDCDVAIFIGTRVGVQIHDPIITGYFRRYGILHDFTGATNLPRFPDLSGAPYPSGNVNNGGDGAHIFNPYIRGPRVNIGVIGALPALGETTYGPDYYDAILGAAVPDARGSFGHSDYLCIGGRLYGPDHHSGWRRKDPSLDGGVLSLASLDSEPDSAPCTLHIDGMAGNSSGGVWGFRFIGTRFATFEALRIRLGRVSRVTFFGCHTEARNGSGFSATGQPIDTNNTVSISYGDIAANILTGSVRSLSTNRQGIADGLGPHFYGFALNVETDSGRYEIPADGFIKSVDDIDLRSDTGVFTLRQGNATIGSINASTGMMLKSGRYAAESGELEIRAATGFLARVRSGATTVATFSTAGSVLTSTIRHELDNVSSFGNPSYRGSTIYLGSNPVVTSDASEKSAPQVITDDVLDAWGNVQLICYQWLASIAEKGQDFARWHFGVIAQQVRDAFAAKGLDGTRYGLLCYDEWESQDEVLVVMASVFDEEGNLVSPAFEQVVQPRREAGSRWGIRADQCLFLEAAYQRRRAEYIEQRLSALEARLID